MSIFAETHSDPHIDHTGIDVLMAPIPFFSDVKLAPVKTRGNVLGQEVSDVCSSMQHEHK